MYTYQVANCKVCPFFREDLTCWLDDDSKVKHDDIKNSLNGLTVPPNCPILDYREIRIMHHRDGI